MVEKIKSDVDGRHMVKKKFLNSTLVKSIKKIFSLPTAKVVYLHPFSSFLPFLKLWKQHFIYSGHKHVETKPSC